MRYEPHAGRELTLAEPEGQGEDAYIPDFGDLGPQSRRAYFKLESLIVTGILKPGQSLSEQGLSQRLGVGRTPVREAIQMLVRDNLILVVPRRGTFVREITPEEQLMLLEVRRPLELLVVRRAATLATEHERDRLATLFDRSVDVAAHSGYAAAMPYVRDYYLALCAAAKHPFLARTLPPLCSASRQFVFNCAETEILGVVKMKHDTVARFVISGRSTEAEKATHDYIDHLEFLTREFGSKPYS